MKTSQFSCKVLSDAEDYAQIFELDLDGILASGAKLLSADTEKYEIKEEPTGSLSWLFNKRICYLPFTFTFLQASENLNSQRKLLNQKLGIDVGGAADLDTRHLFSDEDLILNKTTAIATNKERIHDVLSKTFFPKHKLPTTSDMADVKRSSNGFNETAIVLEQFTDWLVNNLYQSEWEIRHGAVTALRELFKHSLSKISKVSATDKRKLQDFAVKLLTIVSLDKFADYVGDEVKMF
jgi:hypothetical protein